MRGDRFLISGEFRSVCKIWLNSYGTIYRDKKNRLRLSSLDYPPSQKYLSSLEDAVLSLLIFACLFPLPLLVYVRHFRYWFLSFKLDIYLPNLAVIFSLDTTSIFIKRFNGLTGRNVASGSKPRRVLLVFVVKSQRKLRLRQNEKRFDEDTNENEKEDLSEALQVAT
ncbi:hypothetical protein Bca4012_077217 [Brassica carinata]